jgi:hypothetical protein
MAFLLVGSKRLGEQVSTYNGEHLNFSSKCVNEIVVQKNAVQTQRLMPSRIFRRFRIPNRSTKHYGKKSSNYNQESTTEIRIMDYFFYVACQVCTSPVPDVSSI